MAQGMRSCRPAGKIYMDMNTDSPASAQAGASLLANAERLGYAGRGIAGFYQVLTCAASAPAGPAEPDQPGVPGPDENGTAP